MQQILNTTAYYSITRKVGKSSKKDIEVLVRKAVVEKNEDNFMCTLLDILTADSIVEENSTISIHAFHHENLIIQNFTSAWEHSTVWEQQLLPIPSKTFWVPLPWIEEPLNIKWTDIEHVEQSTSGLRYEMSNFRWTNIKPNFYRDNWWREWKSIRQQNMELLQRNM